MAEPAERKNDVHSEPDQGSGRRGPLFVFAASGGSLFATLCCIGLAPLVTLVMAVGLGFIITLTILLPLLIFFLAVGGYGLWRSQRRHGSYTPLLLHTAGGVLIVSLIYTFLHGPLVWVGLGAIFAAAIWNVRLEYAYWHREPEVDFPRTG